MNVDQKFMSEAIKEAQKAYSLGEIPIGAVIVYNNEIISRGYNRKENDKVATKHAEIIAINDACKKIGDWRLEGCTLYVTIEPCLMCCGAILQSRIKKVVYGAKNNKFGYVESVANVLSLPENNHKVEVISGILEIECKTIIQNFFKEKRN